MPRLIDISGQKFGRLTVLEHVYKIGWKCHCECGATTFATRSLQLRSGLKKSCGCYNRELTTARNKTHGMTLSPEHNSWMSAKARCNNPRDVNYKDYGGRGIKMCDRWLASFESFYEDMGKRPSGTSLDRYPNQSGNYEPGNCRWATPIEQATNTRQNVLLTIDGETKPISQWARDCGLRASVIRQRLARGWPAKESVARPSARWPRFRAGTPRRRRSGITPRSDSREQ